MGEAASSYSLAELMVVAASRVFDGEGEVLATGIGVLPRLAASLSMPTVSHLLCHNPILFLA
jgi:glutaconate CoA-transferase, subunit B